MSIRQYIGSGRQGLAIAALVAVVAGAPFAWAASGDGSIVGKITAADKTVVSGADITARNPATGLTRTVKADADGAYRFPFLPVGTYTLEATKGDKSLGSIEDVTVMGDVPTETLKRFAVALERKR